MPTRLTPRTLGAVFGLVSAISFSFMAYFVREARVDFSTGQIILARGLAGIVIFSFISRQDIRNLFAFSALPLWGRAFFGGLSVACFFINLRDCSLGTSIVLTNLSPIFVAVLSISLAREQFRPIVLSGVLAAFFGVAILASPSADSLSATGLAIGIFGAVMGAFAYLSLKQATSRYSFSTIVLAFSVALMIVSLADQTPLLPIKPTANFFLLAAIVSLSLIAQISLTLSYRLLPSTSAATLGLTEVLWSGLLDVFFLGTRAPPLAYAGMFMVVVGARLTFFTPAPADVSS